MKSINLVQFKKVVASIAIFLFLFPLGIVRMWRSSTNYLAKIVYSVMGLPISVLLYGYFFIVVFATFLAPLDLSVGDRQDRTIVNTDGNYSSTFLKTARETRQAYELIQVEVEPGGGNGMHYHRDFEERFTVLEGELTLYVDGKSQVIREGQSAIAPRRTPHYFKNNTSGHVTMRVKTAPARGLEKSIRVAYGLMNTGQWEKDGFAKNPWHLVLLLAYSGTYLSDLPAVIQEPLVDSLARIAQWRGEDRSLELFFK